MGAPKFRGVLMFFVRLVALWISDGIKLFEDEEDLSGIDFVIVVGDHAAEDIGE